MTADEPFSFYPPLFSSLMPRFHPMACLVDWSHPLRLQEASNGDKTDKLEIDKTDLEPMTLRRPWLRTLTDVDVVPTSSPGNAVAAQV